MNLFYPVELFANFITWDLLKLEWHIYETLNFFIYDTIKILFLLLIITQLMSFINIVFPVEKIKNYLNRKKLYWLEYFLASLFWAITPFCSCSSVPLFIGFLKWGIPLWLTFTFLITSPLINEVAIALFIWIFWIKITLIYLFSWIILGMLGWFILWKMKLEKYVEDFVWNIKSKNTQVINTKKDWKEIYKESTKEWFNITKKVLPYVIIWIWIWALIHWYVPDWFFEKHISATNPLWIPIAVILWIPMYANATSVIPIIEWLISKGIPLWTWIAFMMAIIWLSLPEFLILKKVMKTKLLLIFFGIVWFFIILLGYFFNIVL